MCLKTQISPKLQLPTCQPSPSLLEFDCQAFVLIFDFLSWWDLNGCNLLCCFIRMSNFLFFWITAIPEVFQNQENPCCRPEAEQAHPSLDSSSYWQYYQVSKLGCSILLYCWLFIHFKRLLIILYFDCIVSGITPREDTGEEPSWASKLVAPRLLMI